MPSTPIRGFGRRDSLSRKLVLAFATATLLPWLQRFTTDTDPFIASPANIRGVGALNSHGPPLGIAFVEQSNKVRLHQIAEMSVMVNPPSSWSCCGSEGRTGYGSRPND